MWRNLLAAQVDAHGLGAVALKVGYSKATLSLVLNNKYDADTCHIEEAVCLAFGTIACPFEEREMAMECCLTWCNRPVPTSSAWALRHWAACQSCPHNLAERKPSHALLPRR